MPNIQPNEKHYLFFKRTNSAFRLLLYVLEFDNAMMINMSNFITYKYILCIEMLYNGV